MEDLEKRVHGTNWNSLCSETKDFILDIYGKTDGKYEVCRIYLPSPAKPKVVIMGNEHEENSNSDIIDKLISAGTITSEDIILTDHEDDKSIEKFSEKVHSAEFDGIESKRLIEIAKGFHYNANGYGTALAEEIRQISSKHNGQIYQKAHVDHVSLLPQATIKKRIYGSDKEVAQLHIPRGLLYKLEEEKIGYILIMPKEAIKISKEQYQKDLEETRSQELIK